MVPLPKAVYCWIWGPLRNNLQAIFVKLSNCKSKATPTLASMRPDKSEFIEWKNGVEYLMRRWYMFQGNLFWASFSLGLWTEYVEIIGEH